MTHYPPLCELEQLYPQHVSNYHMAFLLNEPDVSADMDGMYVCRWIFVIWLILHHSGVIEALLPVTGCVDRCRRSARVHHFPLPADWRSRWAELRPQCGPTGWPPWFHTAHCYTQSTRAGEGGRRQEVTNTFTPTFFSKERLCSCCTLKPGAWLLLYKNDWKIRGAQNTDTKVFY